MEAISIDDLRRDPEAVLDRVVNDCDETIIVQTGKPAVVIMPLDEYSRWKETHYLLRDPNIRDHTRNA